MKSPNSKISTKYQIVIPKKVRMALKDATPGTEVYVTAVDADTINIKLKKTSWADTYIGIVPLGTYGPDPVKYIRKLRNQWGNEYTKKLKKPGRL